MTPTVHLLVMLATPVVPLVLALLLMLKPRSNALQAAAVAAALPALVTALLVPPGIAATLPWLLEGSEFGLDAIGRIFLLFSASIWLAASWYARGSIAPSERGRFLTFFLLVMSGNLGVLVARDMLAFYLFFALMSFAGYGLVVHAGGAATRRAGKVYMALVVVGDLLLFAALVAAAVDTEGMVLLTDVRDAIAASPRRDMIIALLVVGFGVKVGLLGLHVMLPMVYGVVPVAAGAVFAGAMVNAGLLGWLRFLPLGADLRSWGAALVALGIAAAFYGVAIGVTQRRPAVVLGYSSVSQMGILTAGMGAALTLPERASEIVTALAIYAMHHAFAKSALFLGLGATARAGASRTTRTLLRVGLAWPALALAGAPLTSGMLAKEYLKEAAASDAGAGAWLAAALPWTALATTLIVARFLWLVWPQVGKGIDAGGGTDAGSGTAAARGAEAHFGAEADNDAAPDYGMGAGHGRDADASRRPLLPWLAILALSIVAVWLEPIDDSPTLWEVTVFLELLWPIAAGVLLAAAAAASARAGRRWPCPAVAAGDVAAPALRLGSALGGSWHAFASTALPDARAVIVAHATGLLASPRWATAVTALESLLTRWPIAAGVFVAMIVVLVLLTQWT